MIINGKQALAYDLKVYRNVIVCTFLDTESDDVEVYEVSERINQINDIVGIFLSPDYIFAGYNTIHYSIPVLNFIIDNYRTMPDDWWHICVAVYDISRIVAKSITSEDFEQWKQYKHTRHFLTVDLCTLIAPKKSRVGLREVQITSNFTWAEDFYKSYDERLEQDDIEKLKEYSLHDAKSVRYILYKLEDKIRLREQASKRYNINLLSKDDVGMGLEILKKLYLERAGLEWSDIKEKKSPQDVIALKDCVLPFLEFKSGVLNNLLKEIKETTVNINDKKQYEKHFLLNDGIQNDIEVSFGVGGLHSIVGRDVVVPKDNEKLIYADVRSMYPSFILSYGVVPKHINKTAFLYVFKQIWDERLKAKDSGDIVTSKTLKNVLNSAIGNYRVYQSWLYGPLYAMQVNISCQLFILKLAEMLISSGCKLIQINTDGIIFLVNKDFDYKHKVLDVWEGLTCLSLDTEEFQKIYQYDVNNYLAIRKDGTLKAIGIFSQEQNIGKGMKPKIIAKAVDEYLVNGADVEKTIKESKELTDFLTYQKVDSQYYIEYNDKIIQRINRYYAATNGCYLYKAKVDSGSVVQMVIVHFKDKTYKRVPKTQIEPGGEYFNNQTVYYFEYNAGWDKMNSKWSKYEHMFKASGVEIANDLSHYIIFPENINYVYYIGEAKKIISELENRQLSLF